MSILNMALLYTILALAHFMGGSPNARGTELQQLRQETESEPESHGAEPASSRLLSDPWVKKHIRLALHAKRRDAQKPFEKKLPLNSLVINRLKTAEETPRLK